MPSSLYPGFVKLFYTGNGHPHVMTIPVIPSASGSTWKVAKVLGGDYDPWTTAIDAFNVLFKAVLKTTDGVVSADLYTLASETADPLFRESYACVVAGTSAGTIAANSQAVITLRTSLGGILKLYVMEAAGVVADYVDRAPLAAGGFKNLADFMIASTGFAFGRDGGRPIAPVSLITKTNDALRKKYLLFS